MIVLTWYSSLVSLGGDGAKSSIVILELPRGNFASLYLANGPAGSFTLSKMTADEGLIELSGRGNMYGSLSDL